MAFYVLPSKLLCDVHFFPYRRCRFLLWRLALSSPHQMRDRRRLFYDCRTSYWKPTFWHDMIVLRTQTASRASLLRFCLCSACVFVHFEWIVNSVISANRLQSNSIGRCAGFFIEKSPLANWINKSGVRVAAASYIRTRARAVRAHLITISSLVRLVRLVSSLSLFLSLVRVRIQFAQVQTCFASSIFLKRHKNGLVGCKSSRYVHILYVHDSIAWCDTHS